MEVADGEQLRLALGQPFTRGCRLALRAVPITATIIRNDCVGAALVLAARDVPAERRRAAALDRTHHLHLLQADVATVGFTASGTVGGGEHSHPTPEPPPGGGRSAVAGS